MMRKLAAVFLYSALGWVGGILFVLGALWWFSPSPLPLAPVLLAIALAVILIAWARLHKDETLVENGVSVPAQVTEIARSTAKISLGYQTASTARTLTSCIINTTLTAKSIPAAAACCGRRPKCRKTAASMSISTRPVPRVPRSISPLFDAGPMSQRKVSP